MLLDRSRRSRSEIIAEIISAVINGKTTCGIIEEAHINSKRLKLYLAELSESQLVKINMVGNRRAYAVGPKGIQYLEQFEKLRTLLR